MAILESRPTHGSSPQTIVSQPPLQPSGLTSFQGLASPVHRASTVIFQNTAELASADWRNPASFTYGREGTPTTHELQRQLASIEGCEHVVLTPSGLASFSLVCLALTSAGDVVCIPDNAYGSGAQMLRTVLSRYGVRTSSYDPTQPDTWSQSITHGTRLLWIEAPGSVTMEVPDIVALVSAAKQAGAITAIDNTYSAGLHLKPWKFGIDISIQALTKYQAGSGDVVMGSVSCSDDVLYRSIFEARHFLGMSVSADDAYLVLRGLPTLKMRYQHGHHAALSIAKSFAALQSVQRIMHPALPSCIGHSFWHEHFTSAAALFSIALSPVVSNAQIEAFLNELKLFRIGYSWGGPTSLVMAYDSQHPAVARITSSDRPVAHVVRFWVGLEETADLQADIDQAWQGSIGLSLSQGS